MLESPGHQIPHFVLCVVHRYAAQQGSQDVGKSVSGRALKKGKKKGTEVIVLMN